MTKQHPYSPLEKSKGTAFPSVATLEDRGRSWCDVEPEYLIGFVMESWGTDSANQTPAVMEMQRRLVVAVRAASDAADTQTQRVIDMTDTLRGLTWGLLGIGVVQILIMLYELSRTYARAH